MGNRLSQIAACAALVCFTSNALAMDVKILPASAAKSTRVFSPRKLMGTTADDRGWLASFHRHASGRDVLMVLHSERLELRAMDVVTGEVVGSVDLPKGRGQVEHLQTLSASSGEFLVAYVSESESGERELNLHSDRTDQYFAISLPNQPLSVALAEAGNTYLIVTYAKAIEIYRRSPSGLDAVVEAELPEAIRRTQVLTGTANGLNLMVQTAQAVDVYTFDGMSNQLVKKWGRATQAGLIEATLNEKDEVLLAEISGNNVRVFSEGKSQSTPGVLINGEMGRPSWMTVNRQPVLAGFTRGHGANRMILVDPAKFNRSRSIKIGDTRLATDAASFSIGQRPYYMFVKDQRLIYIQNENETSFLKAKPGTTALKLTKPTRLANGNEAVAVVAEGNYGTRIQVISLTQSR